MLYFVQYSQFTKMKSNLTAIWNPILKSCCKAPSRGLLGLRLKSVFAFVLFCNVYLFQASTSFGQESIHYKFQLADVNDFASAKMVTDVLRPIFNTAEAPFNVYPTFKDETDYFDFFSPIEVTKIYLAALLSDAGIELISFEVDGLEQSSN